MISSQQLGERLAVARKRARLTQAKLAGIVDLSRTTIVAIEKGERRPSSAELVRFARAADVEVNDLLRENLIEGAISPRFRKPHESHEAAVERLRRLGARYVELERMHGLRRSRAPLETLQAYVEESPGGSPRQAEGENAARVVRGLLGLGDGPASNIDERLESEAGLRIFYLDQIPSTLSALFIWSDDFGACIGINAAHPRDQQRWSLLHEVGHFLRDREVGDVLERTTRLGQVNELFPEAFAKEFLLPDAGVKRRFYEICRSGRFTPVDIDNLARTFEVSFQTMALRLEELRLLGRGTYDKIRKNGKKSTLSAVHGEGGQVLEDRRRMPQVFIELSVSAYEQGYLSESEFASFLELDMVGARDLYHRRNTIDLGDGLGVAVNYSADDLRTL